MFILDARAAMESARLSVTFAQHRGASPDDVSVAEAAYEASMDTYARLLAARDSRWLILRDRHDAMLGVLVAVDPEKPDMWRATRFSENGFLSILLVGTREGCIRAAVAEGCTVEASGLLRHLSRLPTFKLKGYGELFPHSRTSA